MDRQQKRQRYSLRKTQVGVGSVLLATVLLSAGTIKADVIGGLGMGGQPRDGVAGPQRDSVIGEPIQGNRQGARIVPKDQNDKETFGYKGLRWPNNAPDNEQRPSERLADGLASGRDSATVESVFKDHPDRLELVPGGRNGGTEIYSNGQGFPDVPIHVPELQKPERKNTPQPVPEPKVEQDTPKVEEQPPALAEPAPKKETESPKTQTPENKQPENQDNKTPEAPEMKQEPGQKMSEQKPEAEDPFLLYYTKETAKPGGNVPKEGFKSEGEKEAGIKKVVDKYTKEGYPHNDRFDNGNKTLLVFHSYKTVIILETTGNNSSKHTSVIYGKNKDSEVDEKVKNLIGELGKTYTVEKSDEKDSKQRTITLTLRPKTDTVPEPGKPTPEVPKEPQIPDVPKEPESPKTPDMPRVPDMPKVPEVPKKPDMPEQPDTPKKPDVPKKPDMPKKPDVPEQPDMPKVPDTPKKPDTSKRLDMPQPPVPEADKMSKADKKPEMSKAEAPTRKQEEPSRTMPPKAQTAKKALPNTGDAASLLTWIGSGLLGLLGLGHTKRRKK